MATAEHREPCESRGSCTVVCPGKASMFSRVQTCRGKSQAPRSSDSRVAGNQDSEAYRRGLSSGRLRVTGPFLYIKIPAIGLALLNVFLVHRSSAWRAHKNRDLTHTERRRLAAMGGISLFL